jgi:hypothetical protein
MASGNLRIAMQNVQRTMTPTQAAYIADSLVRAALSEKTPDDDAIFLARLIAEALEAIPKDKLPTLKQFQRRERSARTVELRSEGRG